MRKRNRIKRMTRDYYADHVKLIENKKQAVLDALPENEKIDLSAIAKAVGINTGKIDRILRELRYDGVVRYEGHRSYKRWFRKTRAEKIDRKRLFKNPFKYSLNTPKKIDATA
jgi:ribosomal protein S25